MIATPAAFLETDLLIVGAGPVGLMSALLAHQRGLRAIVVDKSAGPLLVGRADALNARTLQLLEIAGLFPELYPLGKPCNTSSVWSEGRFLSRQSKWWDEISGCFHKHFLMLGQPFLERSLDEKLTNLGVGARRNTSVVSLNADARGCTTLLSTGETIRSKYVIGADGSRSFVREHFKVPFEITRPEITWAVIDGELATDFPRVPEIIVFQAETSDVAWIPREGNIERFYVRMDRREFSFEETLAKIQRAVRPHRLEFTKVEWSSQFSVKESVAETFRPAERVFLAGDACHIHSVNGGQGLNTGLADAFNLIWKIAQVERHGAPRDLLATYEAERKPVALSVVATSGELVRSTKFSETGKHAEDYVRIVEKRAGNITGMGIRYGESGLVGSRLHDLTLRDGAESSRLYSQLSYSQHTLLLFGEAAVLPSVPDWLRVLRINAPGSTFRADDTPYENLALLVRPDAYIAALVPIERAGELYGNFPEGDRGSRSQISFA